MFLNSTRCARSLSADRLAARHTSPVRMHAYTNAERTV